MISSGTKEIRTTKARELAEKFGKNRMVEKCIFQDEKDFTLNIPINPQNSRVYGPQTRSEISADRFIHKQNRQSKKVMV